MRRYNYKAPVLRIGGCLRFCLSATCRDICIALLLCLPVALSCAAPAMPMPGTTAANADLRSSDLTARFAVYPDVAALLAQDDLGGALTALQHYQDKDAPGKDYDSDPSYQYLLGLLAMKNHAYALAATAFERVVLIDPNYAGAWLDLAIANAEQGDSGSALDYFDYVEHQFAPPADLRAIIDGFRADIAGRTSAPPSTDWRFSLSTMAGYDTNANSGLHNTTIFLTTDLGPQGLLLDPAYNARGDSFVQVGLGARRLLPVDSLYTVELVGNARQRTYRHETDFSTLELNASAGLHRRVDTGDASLWLHTSQLMLGGMSFMRSGRLALQYEQPMGECYGGLSAEVESRRYQSADNLNGDLLWGQSGMACKWLVAGHALQSTVIARIGTDRPTADRAGGRTLRSELVVQLALPAANGSRTELTWQLAHARDREGYSILLEDNAVRRLTREYVRLAWSTPVARATELVLSAENSRILSNLPLFQQSGSIFAVEVRKQF